MYKGFANLGWYGSGFVTLRGEKEYFFDLVFFKCSYNFLSAIFGFLSKFPILKYFFGNQIFFRNRIKSWKSIEKTCFDFFLETNNFHWQINKKVSWKIDFFLIFFSIFHENFILIFNENFWFPKKIEKYFFDTFSRFFSISKIFIFYSKKIY